MGVCLLGDQLCWISSIYSINVLRCLFLLLKSRSHRSICYKEMGNAVAVKMKCYSWNTYVIIWTESPLQWNGCCLATNAKEEPAYFSISPATPAPKEEYQPDTITVVASYFHLYRKSNEDDNELILLVNEIWIWCASQWLIPALSVVINKWDKVKCTKLTKGKCCYLSVEPMEAVPWSEKTMACQIQQLAEAWQCPSWARGFRKVT